MFGRLHVYPGKENLAQNGVMLIDRAPEPERLAGGCPSGGQRRFAADYPRQKGWKGYADGDDRVLQARPQKREELNLAVGGMELTRDQVGAGINDDMTPSLFDPLAPVIG